MFTLGIFTTHLPYIALVVFYAFFWIIGVNKASSGELQSAEKTVLIEFTAGEYFTETTQNDGFDSSRHSEQHFLPTDYNTAFAALQKLKHKSSPTECQPFKHLHTSLFSRPPPFFS